MTIYFLTGNSGKAREAALVIPEITQLKMDLPEIQEADPRKIIEAKLEEARKHHQGPLLVDDTSLFFSAFEFKLPGPLIKWFVTSIGQQRIHDMLAKLEDTQAVAKTILGYSDGTKTLYFEGEAKGVIVAPTGTSGYTFGWDPIFQPEGYEGTYASLGHEIKNKISPRRLALNKLKNYLDQSTD